MQHRIPDRTIHFYCNLLSCDPTDKSIVTKRKISVPTILQPLNKWSKLGDMIRCMINDYLQHYNQGDQQPTKPFIVFCSRVDFSLALVRILRKVAEERFGAVTVGRIKGVWAQIQNNTWCSRFLTNPNTTAIGCDVLIVTNVLQAGHSLDVHFVSSYDMLFNNVLSFREELQFISRLRNLGRTDDRAKKHAWIELGRSNQQIASIEKIRASLSSLFANHEHLDYNLIMSTLFSVNSERADTSNRHSFLWYEEYRQSDVASAFASLQIDNESTYHPK